MAYTGSQICGREICFVCGISQCFIALLHGSYFIPIQRTCHETNFADPYIPNIQIVFTSGDVLSGGKNVLLRILKILFHFGGENCIA